MQACVAQSGVKAPTNASVFVSVVRRVFVATEVFITLSMHVGLCLQRLMCVVVRVPVAVVMLFMFMFVFVFVFVFMFVFMFVFVFVAMVLCGGRCVLAMGMSRGMIVRVFPGMVMTMRMPLGIAL